MKRPLAGAASSGLGAALLAAVVLAASACGSSHTTVRPRPSGPTVSSSSLILGGTVRCTATFWTPVEAGQELPVSFRFHNLSKRTVDVELGGSDVWYVIKGADGTTYDTRVPREGEQFPRYYAPGPMAPGATTEVALLPYIPVRWGGPLRITPGCGSDALRPVRIAVASPGRPASAKAAVTDVANATGHLLDHCRPISPGVAVTGRIDAPKHPRGRQRVIPPLHTRCSVSLRAETGFDVAQVLVTTTPRPKQLRLDQQYERFTWLASSGDQIALAWQFVVTNDGATSVAAATAESGSGRGWAPVWEWTSAGPKGGPPSGDRCGFAGGSSGGQRGPDVTFVSACH